MTYNWLVLTTVGSQNDQSPTSISHFLVRLDYTKSSWSHLNPRMTFHWLSVNFMATWTFYWGSPVIRVSWHRCLQICHGGTLSFQQVKIDTYVSPCYVTCLLLVSSSPPLRVSGLENLQCGNGAGGSNFFVAASVCYWTKFQIFNHAIDFQRTGWQPQSTRR